MTVTQLQATWDRLIRIRAKLTNELQVAADEGKYTGNYEEGLQDVEERLQDVSRQIDAGLKANA